MLLLLFKLLFYIFLDSFFEFFVTDEVRVDLNFFVHAFDLLYAGKFHSVLPEPFFSPVSDISDFLHRLNRLDVEVSIVLDWLMSLFLKLKDGVVGEFLSMDLSVGFGPGKLSRVVFSLEMLMAFGSTKPEDLTVITYEHHAVTWINRPRTKVTFLDSHFNNR